MYKHINALNAFNSLVSSNYKPGTLISDEDDLVRDPDLWRAYKKCANDYDAAITKKDYTRAYAVLKSFMVGIEISLRPNNGVRWQQLQKPWRYEWYLSRKSGNIDFWVRDNIQKYYRKLHNEWKLIMERWEVN
jgi:hypothetical protein